VIDKIINEIYTKGSEYDEIIDNILQPNLHLKPELLSEIMANWLEKPQKIEQVYKDGYLKYYFIMTVKNQVRSNTSSFYKNAKIKDMKTFDEVSYDIEWDTNEEGIEEATDNYNKLLQIKKAINELDVSFFEKAMFQEYYFNGKSYRTIGKEYKIDHVLPFKAVKNVMAKLKEYV